MAPALDVSKPAASAAKAENAKSLQVLTDLLKKLSVSQAQDEINATGLEIATFINGEIETGDVPTQYVSIFLSLCAPADKSSQSFRFVEDPNDQQEGCSCS